MNRVEVELGDRSYPIFIGEDLLGSQIAAQHINGRQVALITNSTIAPLYAARVKAALGNLRVDVFELPDGEAYKNIESFGSIIDWLMDNRHNRSTTLIALGGGVVGDLTGFVAATFQRGVDFIQLPTTLLAQVDSSVGGKTAINHPRGKNMIGAFYQPKCVIADTSVFETLPDREYRAGLAEVVKYGIISDAEFFEWLEDHADGLLRKDAATLTHAIRRSVEIKAEVVASDERETGRRAILNYGHTFGHALETATGYTKLLHGEAVAIGMAAASSLSTTVTGLKPEAAARVVKLLADLGLPTRIPAGLQVQELIDLMRMDKKVIDGGLRLIVADEIGTVQVTAAVQERDVADVLARCGADQ
ncbi:MAG: 3-dehydroquinate synthase [Proteobacteria bacterium]|nr:3-dehydroquinate synthase [Pseudomonadota bacterium]